MLHYFHLVPCSSGNDHSLTDKQMTNCYLACSLGHMPSRWQLLDAQYLKCVHAFMHTGRSKKLLGTIFSVVLLHSKFANCSTANFSLHSDAPSFDIVHLPLPVPIDGRQNARNVCTKCHQVGMPQVCRLVVQQNRSGKTKLIKYSMFILASGTDVYIV